MVSYLSYPIRARLSSLDHILGSIASKRTTVQLGKAIGGSKPLATRAKASGLAGLDDTTETTRKLETLGDLPAVDMSMPEADIAQESTEGVGENLEVDDAETDAAANQMDIDRKEKAKDAMDEDEELDPLDAFMSEVQTKVKQVNADDEIKGVVPGSKSGLAQRVDGDEGDFVAENVEFDADGNEIEATDLNPEDILALAAKKAKKKDVTVVDHSKIEYEPFRKEFYHPPPEIMEMTEEEADLVRLELDGIKIRGVDCPKPIIRWSHCGMPSSVYVTFICLLLQCSCHSGSMS
jgi:ATP-dependent RNA helicase DDX46/PRP5